MDNVDLRYVVGAMAALSGIPVRLLEGEQLVLFKSPVKLLRDPAALYRQEICSVRGHVGYFATPCFHYYGVLNAPGGTIVMGPTCQIMAGEQELRELAFRLDVPREEVPSFLTAMNGIQRLPVETLLQMLCTMNYFLNGGETLTISDVAIYIDQQRTIKAGLEQRRTRRVYEEPPRPPEGHNTLAVEEALMDLVRRGDTAALKGWMAAAPAVRGGTIAPTQLRQLRKTDERTVRLNHDSRKQVLQSLHSSVDTYRDQVQEYRMSVFRLVKKTDNTGTSCTSFDSKMLLW